MPYKSFKPFKGNIIPLTSFILGLLLLAPVIYFVEPIVIFESLKKIALWEFSLILTLKLVFMIFGALKWKIILGFYHQKVSLGKLYLFKFAVSSISYFTPIAAVGGQAVGVMLLRNEKVPIKIGITTMLIDSVSTPLISITVTFLAVTLFLLTKFFVGPILIFGGATLFLISLAIILLFFIFKLKSTDMEETKNNRWLKWKISIIKSLILFADFFKKNKKGTLYLIGLNLLAHASILFETFLVLYFLDAVLGILDLALVEAGYNLAFIIPISQALGTAEASGAYFLSLLGYGAALGVNLTLILRARHLLVGLIGIAVLIFYGVIKLRLPKAL